MHVLSLSPRGRVHEIDWNIMSAEIGFSFGLGLVIGSLVFWKQWYSMLTSCCFVSSPAESRIQKMWRTELSFFKVEVLTIRE